MARIRPFAGWRFASVSKDLSKVTAPPYDVISPAQRAELLSADKHNTVALELPDGPLDADAPGNRYETGRATWDEWREQEILAHDTTPRVYVLEQNYKLDGRTIHRKALIAEVGLEPFDAGIVLPHERTLPKALGDRFQLIKATAANFSQVFGLFDDPEGATDEIFAQAMSGDPIAVATDADGVVSTLWAIDDPAVASDLAVFMADKQIFIADGHHRYTVALAYRDLRRQEAGADASGDEDYNYVMTALVNMDDPDLVVLPTHRVADGVDFDSDAFKAALAENFILEPVDPARATTVLDAIPEPALVVKTRADSAPFIARLRPSLDPASVVPGKHSAHWKSLDVSVLQELILLPLLDIHPDRPDTLDRLHFYKDADAALGATAEHDVAFVLRPTRVEQLRAVALAGETMPQKSTYFYPKLLSGLVFRSAE